jgi:hypothetical protein
VDRQTSKFRSLYQQIDSEDRERLREQLHKKAPEDEGSNWLVIAYWVAAIAIFGGLVFAIVRALVLWLAQSVTFS